MSVIVIGDEERELCDRCGKGGICCEVESVSCWNCGGEGVVGHECGEDCCSCAQPEDNVTCSFCDGDGFHSMCLGRCDENGKHGAEEGTAGT